MKRILVPIDMSPRSANVVEYALQMSQVLQTEVRLCFSFHPEMTYAYQPAGTGLYAPEPQTFFTPDTVQETEKQFREFTQKLRFFHEPDTKVTTEVSPEPQPTLVKSKTKDAAENIGLVVIAGDEQESFLDKVFNTVNNEMIEASRVPVMVVQPDTPFQPIRKILYATDHQPKDVQVLKQLTAFANQWDAVIHALHISTSENNPIGEGTSPEEESKLKSEIYQALGHDRHKVKHTTQYAESTAEGIRQYAQDFDADLIAMLKEGHGLFARLFDESVTDRVKARTTLPVLVFTEKMH